MMKPKTIKTRMIVPATATTAIIITGFCSLETAVAASKRKRGKNRFIQFNFKIAFLSELRNTCNSLEIAYVQFTHFVI